MKTTEEEKMLIDRVGKMSTVEICKVLNKQFGSDWLSDLNYYGYDKFCDKFKVIHQYHYFLLLEYQER